MPLNRINTGIAIRGRVTPNQGQRNQCHAVIAKLEFEDLDRGKQTLYTNGDARLDIQGRTASGDVNLQVQIGRGTVAAALVANSALQPTDEANKRGVRNNAISVLNQSMDFGTVWRLTGTLP